MIKIKKSKAGYRCQYLGKNGEILSTSKVLSSKANAWKNIRAMMNLMHNRRKLVEDENGQKWIVFLSGKRKSPSGKPDILLKK